jgi:hypothetical protein
MKYLYPIILIPKLDKGSQSISIFLISLQIYLNIVYDFVMILTKLQID